MHSKFNYIILKISAAGITGAACFLFLFFSGCATGNHSSKVYDTTTGKSDICAAHNVKMEKKTIDVRWVSNAASWNSGLEIFSYSHAKTVGFPNGEDEFTEDPSCCGSAWDKEIVFVCEPCVVTRKQWIQEHPELKSVSDL